MNVFFRRMVLQQQLVKEMVGGHFSLRFAISFMFAKVLFN